MPISDPLRAGGLLAAGLALAGCAAGPEHYAPTRNTVQVGGAPLTIAAPDGFCIDARSTNVARAGAFFLLSDCALLGWTPAAGSVPAGAALTASIVGGGFSEGDSDGLDALEAFALAPEGRALLSRSGQPEQVRILDTQRRAGALYVLVDDRGAQPISGVERRFWRTFLEVNGRVAVLSVIGFEGAGVTTQQGFDYLSAFADAIRAANPS